MEQIRGVVSRDEFESAERAKRSKIAGCNGHGAAQSAPTLRCLLSYVVLRERLRGRRAARLVSGGVWIGVGSIFGEKNPFWLRRVILISGGPVDSR